MAPARLCSRTSLSINLASPGFYLGCLVWGGGGGGGGKMIVDGGCSHRPQFSRGVWGHAPPDFFLNFEPSESGSEAF